MINETIEFKVKSNSYKIENVRVGNFIDFERMKASISGGMYGSILRMGTVTGDEALTMIDIEAFYTVFCPQLLKDLECKNFKELGLVDYNTLKEIYTDKIVPWYNSYIKLLRPEKKEEETVKE